MKIERKVTKWGDSIGFVIPKDLANHLGVNVGDDIILQDEEGKKGKFCSFWKKK